MLWQLTDTVRIKVIPLNFVLEMYEEGGINPKTRKQAPAKWRIKGYYSTLEKAIAALPSELAQHPDVETFEGLCARIDKLAGQLARRVGHA